MVAGLKTKGNRWLLACMEWYVLLHYSDGCAIPASQQFSYRKITVQAFTLFILSCLITSLTCILSKSKTIPSILGTVSEQLPLTLCPYNLYRKSVTRKEGALCMLFPCTGNPETQDMILIFSQKMTLLSVATIRTI